MSFAALDKETTDLLAYCDQSLGDYCRVFYPERFDRPFTSQHEKLFSALDDRDKKFVLIVAHRGFGKTTILNNAFPSREALFQHHDFIVPVSCTSTLAVMQSENLKSLMRSNDVIKGLIGDIKTDNFSREQWEMNNGTYILPRGAGQQIRGLLHDGDRPNLVIVDDLEDPEEVLSEDLRAKLKQWFYGDLMLAVDKAKDDFRIIVVGTLLHEDSLLANLMEDTRWHKIVVPLFDENLESLWPEFMTTEAIKKMHDEYEQHGMLHVFYREYGCVFKAHTKPSFHKRDFQYYDDQEAFKYLNDECENIILVDPTKSETPQAAFSGIVGVAWDASQNRLYIRRVVNEKLTHDDLYEATMDMARELNAFVIGIEVTSLKDYITKPFKDAMFRRGEVYELVELQARQGKGEYSAKTKGKAGRVASLAPYYKQHIIYHNPDECGALEDQLLSFPYSKYWDVMDALSYVVQMTSIGERFMSLDEAYLPRDEDDHQMSAEEWEELELERMMKSDPKPQVHNIGIYT